MTDYPNQVFAPRPKENKPNVVFDANKKRTLFVEDMKVIEDEIIEIEKRIMPDTDDPLPYGLTIGDTESHLKIEKLIAGGTEYPIPEITQLDGTGLLNCLVLKSGIVLHSDTPLFLAVNDAVTKAGTQIYDFDAEEWNIQNIITSIVKVMSFLFCQQSLQVLGQLLIGAYDFDNECHHLIVGGNPQFFVPYGMKEKYNNLVLDGALYAGKSLEVGGYVADIDVADTIIGQVIKPITKEGSGTLLKTYGLWIDEQTVGNENHGIMIKGDIDAKKYIADGTEPVADNTYTIGAPLTPGIGLPGTITVKGGIITAIQEAT